MVRYCADGMRVFFAGKCRPLYQANGSVGTSACPASFCGGNAFARMRLNEISRGHLGISRILYLRRNRKTRDKPIASMASSCHHSTALSVTSMAAIAAAGAAARRAQQYLIRPRLYSLAGGRKSPGVTLSTSRRREAALRACGPSASCRAGRWPG